MKNTSTRKSKIYSWKPLKEKRSRKQWVKILDDLARKVVYARDGNRSVKSGRAEHLNMAHCYPKGRYTRMRWEIDNLLTLTWDEHLEWAHKNPIEFTEWFKEKFPERYKKLRLMAMYVDRSPIDYPAIKLYLEQLLKKPNLKIWDIEHH